MGTNRFPKLGQLSDVLQQSADLARYDLPLVDPTLLCRQDTALSRIKADVLANQNQDKDQPPSYSCEQVLWLSFFFDGTGNNLDADTGTHEHSNVARMFRAMPLDNKNVGRYSVYVPGIGTYFKEIGDPGGTTLGLAFAKDGEARLLWALRKFDEFLATAEARAANPTSKILKINVAVFGFSRGATLARAFVRELAKRCLYIAENEWQHRSSKAPIEVKFLGLWDTVASVGLVGSALGTLGIRPNPIHLAFGEPGADPTQINIANGHGAWASDLKIGGLVKECVHHVSAHEMRNSFPLDSVTRNGEKIANSKEVVYPGVHSDVGGGYRPGEQGRSARRVEMLSLVSLREMYKEALKAGVPLLSPSTWEDYNEQDFEIDEVLIDNFNHYQIYVNANNLSLGEAINKHQAVYFAWRFQHIRKKLTRLANSSQPTDEKTIEQFEADIEHDERALHEEIDRIQKEDGPAITQASRRVTQARDAQRRYYEGYVDTTSDLSELAKREAQAQEDLANAQDRLLRARARQATLPSRGKLVNALRKFDRKLLQAAEDIYARIQEEPGLRNRLRPHYKGLITAYENEFIHKSGLTDEKIISFFDNFVHDSLAGFDLDGTDPSDPRVVYAGGNLKLRFAAVGRSHAEAA
ncbi:MAG TPA: DUF2235 domain-containing protein [Burkholderiaceae bacterium]|nr:DUF2235 domain-containing protein [Burkholderiaceae bacterium]